MIFWSVTIISTLFVGYIADSTMIVGGKCRLRCIVQTHVLRNINIESHLFFFLKILTIV